MRRRKVLGLLAAAPRSSGPPRRRTPTGTRSSRRAKKEGKLVIYTASIGSPFHKTVFKAFEKKYGIKVELLEARASEVRERVRVEQSAGRFLGDLHHNGSTTTWLMHARRQLPAARRRSPTSRTSRRRTRPTTSRSRPR